MTGREPSTDQLELTAGLTSNYLSLFREIQSVGEEETEQIVRVHSLHLCSRKC